VPQPLHIGIVGCSAEGAALCYRTICAEGGALLGRHAHPEISMHTPSLAKYFECLGKGDLEGVAELMLDSARRLEAAGAQFLICPDNTIHQAVDLVSPKSPLPWLHIAEVVANEAKARGFKRVGLTGTRWLVESRVYPEKLEARGIEWLRPVPEDCERTDRIIMDELVPGTVRPGSVETLQAVVRRLAAQSCDSVILGCTELPLALDDRNSPLPTLDSTRLLARAALKTSINGRLPN
jgi:aspartate racemase